jgi:glyoxylase-like metal-dependent hydrolase (beta-lactamase superfamily II)
MSELTGLSNPRLRVVQLLCGEDLATSQSAELAPTEQGKALKRAIFQGAAQSRNFIYLIIDKETSACACVDCCWDAAGLLRIVRGLELNLVAALYTHRHPDHTGGAYAKVAQHNVVPQCPSRPPPPSVSHALTTATAHRTRS